MRVLVLRSVGQGAGGSGLHARVAVADAHPREVEYDVGWAHLEELELVEAARGRADDALAMDSPGREAVGEVSVPVDGIGPLGIAVARRDVPDEQAASGRPRVERTHRGVLVADEPALEVAGIEGLNSGAVRVVEDMDGVA